MFKNLLKSKVVLVIAVVLSMLGIIFVTAAPTKPDDDVDLTGGFILVKTPQTSVLQQITGSFRDMSELNNESSVVETRVSGTKGSTSPVLKMPGAVKYGTIQLKRFINSDMSFYNWRDLVLNGKINNARTKVNIKVYNNEGDIDFEWELTNAWPSKLDYSTDVEGQIIETVSIVYEGQKRLK